MNSQASGKPKSIVRIIVDFLSSFGLATVLFVLLGVLVLFATLAQTHVGTHDVIRDYFSSAGVMHYFYKDGPDGEPMRSTWGIPLVGGYPLMALLFVNILLGGLIRIRKKPQTVGVVISHFSILVLLAWGFVTNHFVDEGNVRIFEGEEIDYFTDYTKWDMELVQETGENARSQVFVIPFEQIKAVEGDGSRRVFENGEWPFDIAVANYMRNSAVRLAADAPKDARAVDGYALEEKAREKQAELNIPGLYVDVSADGETVGEGIVWGLAREPLTITAPSGDKWSLQIRKRVYELPYSVKLRDFIKEDHPGTAMARRYMSDVTRIDGDLEEDVRIRMNHPMASGQYTFYQASFGPQEGDPPGTPPYSVLAVWKRPLLAGDWPLFACFTVALGLMIHFVMGLVKYFKREALHEARRAAKEQTPAEA